MTMTERTNKNPWLIRVRQGDQNWGDLEGVWSTLQDAEKAAKTYAKENPGCSAQPYKNGDIFCYEEVRQLRLTRS